jgi:hypothetical protein
VFSSGKQLALPMLNHGQRSEVIVFDFVDSPWIIEWLRQAD